MSDKSTEAIEAFARNREDLYASYGEPVPPEMVDELVRLARLGLEVENARTPEAVNARYRAKLKDRAEVLLNRKERAYLALNHFALRGLGRIEIDQHEGVVRLVVIESDGVTFGRGGTLAEAVTNAEEEGWVP